MLKKVENEPSLVKDIRTGAVININTDELQAYKLKKERERRLTQIEKEHCLIKNDLQEIKQILKALMERSK